MYDFDKATYAIRGAISKEASNQPTSDLNNQCDFIRIKNLSHAALCLFEQRERITSLEARIADAQRVKPPIEGVV